MFCHLRSFERTWEKGKMENQSFKWNWNKPDLGFLRRILLSSKKSISARDFLKSFPNIEWLIDVLSTLNPNHRYFERSYYP